ncbi:hypothetical protein [Actinoplanes sp. NPDC020271]|uniref:hypothetical protein n=1 Tax=Actinoplanes sp. NPDC020271 TaxID=3363896 RepID=UPI003794685F
MSNVLIVGGTAGLGHALAVACHHRGDQMLTSGRSAARARDVGFPDGLHGILTGTPAAYGITLPLDGARRRTDIECSRFHRRRTLGSTPMALLSLDLRRPAGAFLYNATTPRITIDGHEVAVHGWGVQHFDLIPGGPHNIKIHVPYVLPRRVGRAALDFMVPEQGVALEYMAPAFTFAKGNLGAPGAQKSSGFRATWAINIAVFVLVVGAYVYARSHG